MRGRRTLSSSGPRRRAREVPRRSSHPGRGRGAAGSRRGYSPNPRGRSGRSRRRCPALRVSGPAFLPHLHPPFEFLDLIAFMVAVRDVALLFAQVFVHARTVLVVFLAVPLIAILAQMLRRQLGLELDYIPQNGSSFRLILLSWSSASISSWLRSVRSRRARASSSGRSTYRTSPLLTCRPIVTPSTEIATSCPWIASSKVFSPLRIDLIRPRGRPSSRTRDSPARIRTARIRTPKIAGLETRKIWSGRKSSFAGYARSLRLAASSCLLRSSLHAPYSSMSR